MQTIHINSSEIHAYLPKLRTGDRVFLSGCVYTARDAAHQRIFELLDSGMPLPFELESSIIYYAGPTPAQQNMPTGSCGPTTSSRMDAFTPRLLSLGLPAMIGKGERSTDVVASIKENGAVYFCATGGAGALIARCITEAEEIAFPELGCESIKRFTVKELPLIVAVDSQGNDIFQMRKNK